MASEKVLNQKKEEVKKLAEEMKEAKLILLTDYRGINVADDTVLRKDLRNANATYRIIKNNITPIYECDCSKKHMEEALIAIGKEELYKIIEEDGKAELMCHFCNKKYQFSKDELLKIYQKYNENE